MIVLVDQDQTIANFEGYFLKRWRMLYPRRKFIPLEKRKNFQIADDYPQRYKKDIYGIFSAPGFFLNLPLIAGAPAAIAEMEKLGFDVYICTSPLSGAPRCLTEKYLWVEKYLGPSLVKKLIITKDKTLVRGDFLIDDKPEITGAREPIWRHILFDAPHNRHIKDKPRLNWSNWGNVLLKEYCKKYIEERRRHYLNK